MASVQLNFSLRTTPTVKTVHLLGSWDNYQGQLPLSRDATKKSSSGAWTGTFRFQPGTLQAGARYWYYVSNQSYQCTDLPMANLNLLSVHHGRPSCNPRPRS